jgi:hypothetical protein
VSYSDAGDAQGWGRDDSGPIAAEPASDPVEERATETWQESVPEPEVVEGAVVQERDVSPVIDGEEAPQAPADGPAIRGRGPRRRGGSAQPRTKKADGPKPDTAAPRARKSANRPKSASPSRPRSRKSPPE